MLPARVENDHQLVVDRHHLFHSTAQILTRDTASIRSEGRADVLDRPPGGFMDILAALRQEETKFQKQTETALAISLLDIDRHPKSLYIYST
jgi:hypothetical protein